MPPTPPTPRADSDLSGRAQQVEVSLDTKVFSPEAVLRAAYWFSGDWEVAIVPAEPSEIKVMLTPKGHTGDKASADIVGRFCSAVMDAELRIQIARETAAIRELILAKAFSAAGVLEPESPE